MMHMDPTRHFLERSQERRLAPDVLHFILVYGMELRARGATHLTVLARRLPPDLRQTVQARRALDWIVILDDEGRLLTCYRRRHASRYLRKKTKTRQLPDIIGLCPGRWRWEEASLKSMRMKSNGALRCQ